MARRLDPPLLAPLGGEEWRLEREYVLHDRQRRRVVTVERGFTYDLGSIPRPLWGILGPQEIPAASLVHDWLYWHGGLQGVTDALGAPACYTRRDADDLLRDVAEAEIGITRAWLAWCAVRLFGGSGWGRGTR